MRKLQILLLISVLTLNLAACGSSEETSSGPITTATQSNSINAAKKIIVLLSQKKYSEVKSYYDDSLKSQTDDLVAIVWNDIINKYGAFKKEYDSRSEISQGFEIVYVTCGFEKGYADVTVQFSSPERLAIIGFKPSDKK